MDQARQFRPRHNNIHLTKKFTLTRYFDDQFKIGGGEVGFLHEVLSFKPSVIVTYFIISQDVQRNFSAFDLPW